LLLDLKLPALSRQKLLNERPAKIAVFLKRDIEEAELLQLFLAVSKHRLIRRICGNELAVRVGQCDSDDRILENRSPEFLASRKLSVRLLQGMIV